MFIADAQIHVVESDSQTSASPWNAEQSPIPKIDADGVVRLLDSAGVKRAILVPPTRAGDDNEAALLAAQRYPDRLAVMGLVELENGPKEAFLRWRDKPGMLGIRLNFGKDRRRGWVLDDTFEWFWELAETQALPVMIFAPGQTPDLGELARRYPRLRIVLDHLNVSGEPAEIRLDEVLAPLYSLAAQENVAVKLSALPCYVDEPYPFVGLRPHIDRVINTFGAQRCIWGSDVTRLRCSYRAWLDAMLEAIGDRDETDQAAIMGGSLSTWLRWPTDL